MVFFWHRYELPAVAYGLVTVDRPRMQINEAILYAGDDQSLPPQQHTTPQPRTNERQQETEGHSMSASHPSFSTTSSRNTSGLFRQNDEDDDGSSYTSAVPRGRTGVLHVTL